PQRQGQPVAITEVGKNEHDNSVDGPRMQTPVEECDLHGLACGLYSARVTHRWIDKMHDGFGHAKEHQANSHPGGKQHGEPGNVPIVGLAVIRTKLNVAIAAYRHEYDGKQNNRYRKNIEPTGVF